MTATTALVGPLPTIRFHDGTKLAYDIPKDTLDKRYAACCEHHPACDCREAEMSEDRGEHRAAMDEARGIIAQPHRLGCSLCRGALTTWLHRYDAVWPRRDDETAF